MAAFTYSEPARWLITSLKFQGRRQHSRLLATALARCIASDNAPLPDLLVPVPLHRLSHRRRGFNQAELLARLIGRQTGVEIEAKRVSRTQAAPPQSQLNAKHRQQNIRGVFACHTRLDGQHVAIIDDVMTTGATAAELAQVLRQAGATYVDIYSVARAMG